MHRRIHVRTGVVRQCDRQCLRSEHRVARVFLLRVIAPHRDDDWWMRRMGLGAMKQLAAEINEFHWSTLRARCGTMLGLCLVREEATMAGLSDILETTQLEKVAGGFVFTEGPLWQPDG